MALPKLDYPISSCVVPSTKKKVNFRPMRVKEEKLLLMAKTSDNIADIYTAIKQVVTNCVIDDKFDVDKIPSFDLEYIFIMIRAASISNIIKVVYKDLDDGREYTHSIDLNKVEVIFPEKVSSTIEVNESIGFTLSWPTGETYDDEEFLEYTGDPFDLIFIKNLVSIYENDSIILAKDCTREDIVEFIDSLDVNTYQRVKDFFNQTPHLYYQIKYVNSNQKERDITLQTLTDFFTLQ